MSPFLVVAPTAKVVGLLNLGISNSFRHLVDSLVLNIAAVGNSTNSDTRNAKRYVKTIFPIIK